VADFVVFHQLVDSILQQKARHQAAEKAKLDETEKTEREEAEKVRSETSALFISNLPEVTLHYAKTKIPITQTNIPLPSADTVIASLSPPETHGTTGDEQTSKRSRLTSAIHELANFPYQNLSDAVLSRPTSPSLEGAQPGPSSELVRPPQPDLTVTSLSNIGMSLETEKSGFHLVFHCI
jgi:hypothetical protein